MKRHYMIIASAIMAFFVMGCAPVKPVPPCSVKVVDGNGQQLVGNNPQPDQQAEIQVSFTWNIPGDGGCHKYHWEIYKEEKLFFKGKDQPYASRSIPFDNPCYRFLTSPYLIKEFIKLPRGNFRYVLFVDGAETVNIPFKVRNKNYTLNEHITINTKEQENKVVKRETGKRLDDFETLEECRSALLKATKSASANSRFSCDRIGDDGLMVPFWK